MSERQCTRGTLTNRGSLAASRVLAASGRSGYGEKGGAGVLKTMRGRRHHRCSSRGRGRPRGAAKGTRARPTKRAGATSTVSSTPHRARTLNLGNVDDSNHRWGGALHQHKEPPRLVQFSNTGQAVSDGITPCQSAAARGLSEYDNRPPRQRESAQWRPNEIFRGEAEASAVAASSIG